MNILTLDTEVYSHMYIHNKMEDLVKAGLVNSHHFTLKKYISVFVLLHLMVHKTQATIRHQYHTYFTICMHDYVITERYPAHARTSTTARAGSHALCKHKGGVVKPVTV